MTQMTSVETDLEHQHDDGTRHRMSQVGDTQPVFWKGRAVEARSEYVCDDCHARVFANVVVVVPTS